MGLGEGIMITMPENIGALDLFDHSGKIPGGGLLIGSDIPMMISSRLKICCELGLNLFKARSSVLMCNSSSSV